MRYAESDPVVRHFAAYGSLPAARVAVLADRLLEFFAGDEMLVELRLVRIIDAIKRGSLSLDDAIAEYGGSKSAA